VAGSRGSGAGSSAPFEPDDCLGCGRNLRHPLRSPAAGLCIDCYMRIPWIAAPACVRCGRNELCPDCRRRPSRYFRFSRSAVAYTPLMKEWLSAYKFRGNERWADPLAHMLQHGYRLLLDRMRETGAGRPHAIAYVPLSEVRLRERGFNQAEQLARRLGRAVGLPVLGLLERSRHSDRQSWKARRERVAGLRDAYRLSEAGRRMKICGTAAGQPRIVLVDDVYTTGTTLDECARVLAGELGAEVFGLTWGR